MNFNDLAKDVSLGFEIKKDFFKAANEKILSQPIQQSLF